MDRQWQRRCKVEELNLVDSFNGPKFAKMAQIAKPKPSFYAPPLYSNLDKLKQKTIIKYSEEKKHAADDDLDDVSRVSVLTPKTNMSASRVSYVSNKSKSVDHFSSVSKTTTQSTIMKMQNLQKELEIEKRRREEAEREISMLKGGSK